MAVYRSAQGKAVDMSALAAKNEKTRAVGNMPVNARGDTIDSHGKVILPVTKKVGAKYQRAVSNRAAALAQQEETPTETITKVELTEEDRQLAKELEELAEFEISEEDLEDTKAKKKK